MLKGRLNAIRYRAISNVFKFRLFQIVQEGLQINTTQPTRDIEPILVQRANSNTEPC